MAPKYSIFVPRAGGDFRLISRCLFRANSFRASFTASSWHPRRRLHFSPAAASVEFFGAVESGKANEKGSHKGEEVLTL